MCLFEGLSGSRLCAQQCALLLPGLAPQDGVDVEVAGTTAVSLFSAGSADLNTTAAAAPHPARRLLHASGSGEGSTWTVGAAVALHACYACACGAALALMLAAAVRAAHSEAAWRGAAKAVAA